MNSIFPIAPVRFTARPHAASALFLVIFLSLTGCDSCLGRRAAPGVPAVQSPAAPLPVPAVQTPASPAPAPAVEPLAPSDVETQVPPAPEEEAAPAPAPYDISLLQNIKPGMSYEEVRNILGDPGMVIAGTDQVNQVYRWSSSGLSFMGRFENGTLIRKNIISPDYGAPVPDTDTLQFDRSLFETVQPGMSFDEVLALIGMDAQPLTTGDTGVKIYKWTDANGSSITARFEGGVLTRKSGMVLTPGTKEADETEPPTEPGQAASRDQATETPAAAAEPQPLEEEAAAPEPAAPYAQTEKPRSRVHVVGSTRREREIANDPDPNAGRSYRPKTEFPEYKRKVRTGSYEILIHNTTSSKARIAIISGEYGIELTVGPEDDASVKVDRGNYQFYYIFDDDPYTLHQGQRIPVEEMMTDFVLSLFDDSSQVDPL